MPRRFALGLCALVALFYGAIPGAAQSLIHLSPGGDLNGAIRRVSPNGAIELAAGVYPAPPGGFRITNPGKAFTLRAAANANVVLDGGGSRPILVYRNNSLSRGGLVTFRRLTFANGQSTTEGISGGVTLYAALASFVRCTFSGNAADPATTGGGGAKVLAGSSASFTDCVFAGNHSKNRGGAMTVRDASATILRGRFVANRVDLPGHQPQAAGGAIYVLDATLDVADSHFAGNRAGFAGGALYAFGDYGAAAKVVVTGSTFLDNAAAPDPCCAAGAPTAGGAVHVEDRTSLRVERSRFEGNEANLGGAVDAYRASVEIDGSLFTANQATAGAGSVSAGGAIAVFSSDPPGESGNRRPASLVLRDSLLQGLPGAQPAAQAGGCLLVAGDDGRMYGDGGVTPSGTVADNRAPVTLSGDVFSGCAAAGNATGAGSGGAIQADLVALAMTDCQVLGSQAQGDGARGGGMALVRESTATITGTTFAANSAVAFGGGLFVNGSTLQMAGGAFLANELSPGVFERITQSHGAALFTTPLASPARPVSGAVSGTVFSGNVGLPIWDFEERGGAPNDVRYDANPISSQSFGSLVYADPQAVPTGTDVFGLNVLVVPHGSEPPTPKSDSPNTQVFGPVRYGALRAVPPTATVGAPTSSAPSFVAFAWSGNLATFANQPLTLRWGLAPAGAGTYSLVVDGTTVGTVTVTP